MGQSWVRKESEIVSTQDFTSMKFKMTIRTSRSGYKQFIIKRTDRKKFTPTLSVEYDAFSEKKPFIEIQTTSYGAITAEEAMEFTTQWIEACNAATYFNKVLEGIEQ